MFPARASGQYMKMQRRTSLTSRGERSKSDATTTVSFGKKTDIAGARSDIRPETPWRGRNNGFAEPRSGRLGHPQGVQSAQKM